MSILGKTVGINDGKTVVYGRVVARCESLGGHTQLQIVVNNVHGIPSTEWYPEALIELVADFSGD